jgi:hypothetical protein
MSEKRREKIRELKESLAEKNYSRTTEEREATGKMIRYFEDLEFEEMGMGKKYRNSTS